MTIRRRGRAAVTVSRRFCRIFMPNGRWLCHDPKLIPRPVPLTKESGSPDDNVAIVVGSSSSALHRVAGSVAVSLARHSPVPVVIVP